MPPVREVHQMTFENGLILGYSQREHEVPEGYVVRARNVIMQEDGSYTPRPGTMVTEANGWGVGAADVDWDQAITSRHRVLLEQDDSFHVAGRTNATHVAAPLGGTTIPPGSTSFWVQYMIVGEAATYGTTTVVPVARPTYNNVSDPAGGPAPGRLAVVHALYFDSSTTVPTAVGNGNLYDINGHFIVQEPVQFQQSPGDAVFARMVAITWKSRIFIIAGTRVTYSAAGNPTSYSAANGGGFFNLDTDSQAVGAFVLEDNLYILTRRELFSFNYGSNPSVDGQLRTLAKINGLGAAEYDNVGYLAVREGMFRVLDGQIQPTLVPSSESHMSFQTEGWPEIPVLDGVTDFPDRIEVPVHCTISKVGSQILLSGIGTNLVDFGDDTTPDCFVFNTKMEAWTTWGANSSGSSGQSRWFNLLTPLIRTDVQEQWGSEQYVGTNIQNRYSNLSTRKRSFIVVNVEDASSGPQPGGQQIARWFDTYVNPGETEYTFRSGFNPEIITGYFAFEDPLSFKRLHRAWMTGRFKPQATGAGDDQDFTTVVARIYTGPDTDIQVANWAEKTSITRATPDLFDISPRMIKFFGNLRFMYIGFRVSLSMFDDIEVAGTEDSFKFANTALSSICFDITKTDRKSNRTY